jgi:hypothetical protein
VQEAQIAASQREMNESKIMIPNYDRHKSENVRQAEGSSAESSAAFVR